VRQTSRRPSQLIGRALTWITAGTLALNLLLILGVLALVGAKGLGTFWPRDLVRLEVEDGRVLLGEVRDREEIPEARAIDGRAPTRIRLKLGNRDLGGSDFAWVDEAAIVRRELPEDAALLERLEWGNFYGFLRELRGEEAVLASGSEEVWRLLPTLHGEKRKQLEAIHRLERDEIDDVNRELEKLRLAERRLDLEQGSSSSLELRRTEIREGRAAALADYEVLADQLDAARSALEAETLVVESADGRMLELPLGRTPRAASSRRSSGP
jgi:phosphate transport system permease protein